mmetsp:Transcript_82025/g.265788  ORF Transcript_82025/g.265788 Transcript_82025/m.265788 type:complete len:106 (+) Transcript_82025:45-362(+)
MSTVDPDAVAVFGEEELPVHSLLLRLASPFFEAMFVNKMAESRHRRFDVHIASKDEFQVFYDWLHPVSGRDLAITLGTGGPSRTGPLMPIGVSVNCGAPRHLQSD